MFSHALVPIRLVLEDHVGSAAHAHMSKVQAAALVEVAAASSDVLSAELADLSATATSIQWAGKDIMVVLDAFSPPEKKPRARRRFQQDWTCVMAYGDESFWQTFEAANAEGKLQTLVNLAIRTGLRCPTEPTVKWLTAVWIASTHNDQQMANMNLVTKISNMVHVKTVCDAVRKKLPDPVQHLEQLPSDPMQLLAKHELLFKSAFAQGKVPIQPPATYCEQRVRLFNQSFGCRGGGKVAAFGTRDDMAGQSRRALQVRESSPSRHGGSGIERIAGVVLKQMTTMADQQQRMMEMIVGGVHAGMRSQHMSQPMLEDRRPLAAPLPALEDDTRRNERATMLRSLSLASLPPATSPETSSALVVPDIGRAAASTAKGAFDDMLEALASRKAGRRDDDGSDEESHASPVDGDAECKQPPQKKKARNGGVGGKAAGAAAEQSQSPKDNVKIVAKAKAKATAKAGAPVKPKAKISAKHITAEPEAKASAKPQPKPPTKKGVKAADKAVEEDPVKPLILGCSKCRWSACGCSQCRNLAYKGPRWNSCLTSDGYLIVS